MNRVSTILFGGFKMFFGGFCTYPKILPFFMSIGKNIIVETAPLGRLPQNRANAIYKLMMNIFEKDWTMGVLWAYSNTPLRFLISGFVGAFVGAYCHTPWHAVWGVLNNFILLDSWMLFCVN